VENDCLTDFPVSGPEVFKLTRYYKLFESRLGPDQVDELVNVVIGQDALTQNEIDRLMHYHGYHMHTKQTKLINLLDMLNYKANGKDILMNACHSLADENQHSWFPDIKERIRESE
jgi:hypothetical protein